MFRIQLFIRVRINLCTDYKNCSRSQSYIYSSVKVPCNSNGFSADKFGDDDCGLKNNSEFFY